MQIIDSISRTCSRIEQVQDQILLLPHPVLHKLYAGSNSIAQPPMTIRTFSHYEFVAGRIHAIGKERKVV